MRATTVHTEDGIRLDTEAAFLSHSQGKSLHSLARKNTTDMAATHERGLHFTSCIAVLPSVTGAGC